MQIRAEGVFKFLFYVKVNCYILVLTVDFYHRIFFSFCYMLHFTIGIVRKSALDVLCIYLYIFRYLRVSMNHLLFWATIPLFTELEI